MSAVDHEPLVAGEWAEVNSPSGDTREGPAFAVYELTEERFATLQI